MSNQETHVTLPTDLVERLRTSAQQMGVDLPAYLVHLEQCRLRQLDSRAQDAARYMFKQHAESLRKLAQ